MSTFHPHQHDDNMHPYRSNTFDKKTTETRVAVDVEKITAKIITRSGDAYYKEYEYDGGTFVSQKTLNLYYNGSLQKFVKSETEYRKAINRFRSDLSEAHKAGYISIKDCFIPWHEIVKVEILKIESKLIHFELKEEE